ncbi:MAG: metallophosphoesterase [Prolixibacteraceae bacterium]|jgi:DNA repair exonuclease SbcCD nuclease subunit|nr:metallophosphoesterase [Prolixibacteraceae bacterium]
MTHSFHQKLIGLFAGILIAGTVFSQDTLSFLHVTDLHLIFNPERYQENLAQSRKHYAAGVEPFAQFLKTMPEKTNSNMVIATGDLFDSYETEAKSGEMLRFQASQFLGVLKKSKVPVFLTLGNHDLTSYSWKNNVRVSKQDNAGAARARWIRDVPHFNDGTYYSHTVKVGATNYRLIFLDNSFYRFHPEEKVEIPYLDKVQLHWLKAQLQESPDDVEIIMMHIPMKAATGELAPSCGLYPVLAKNPSAKLILAGHHHKNTIQDFPSGENKKMLQVQTGAFAQDTKNWRLIRLTENSILVSVPGDVKTEVNIPVN